MNVGFVLPLGLDMGGTNIWSMQMVDALQDQGQVAPKLLLHDVSDAFFADRKREYADKGCLCDCGKRSIEKVSRWNIGRFVRQYEGMLPGVSIPNFSPNVYAICAKLSMTRSEELRVLAVAHSDNDSWYDEQVYYEPIISRYIAVSDVVAEKLREKLPHRAADIVVRSCPVHVANAPLQRIWSANGAPLRLTYAGRIDHGGKRMGHVIPLVKRLRELRLRFNFASLGKDLIKTGCSMRSLCWIRTCRHVSLLRTRWARRICRKSGLIRIFVY